MRKANTKSERVVPKFAINVTPEAKRIAKKAKQKIEAAMFSVRKRFGGSKIKVSQDALVEFVAILGPDVVEDLEVAFRQDALFQAAISGSSEAREEIFRETLFNELKTALSNKDGNRK